MAWDGNGNFLRVMDWTDDAAAGIKIRADRHDQEDDNFAQGIGQCLTKDGQSTPTANLDMNGFKVINMGAPTANADAATKAYVDALKTFTKGVTLSGNNIDGTITWSGTQTPSSDPASRPLGLRFTQADLFFGVKPGANPGASDLPRWVWNDNVSGTGNDRMFLTDEGELTLQNSLTGATVNFISTATGAASGPNLLTRRRNGSPAAGDNIGAVLNYARNSADADAMYTAIYSSITKTTANDHEGELTLRVSVAGAMSVRARFNATNSIIAALKATDAELTTPKFLTNATVEWTDDGSGSGPLFLLDRFSASPAANDFLGQIRFRGKNSAQTTVSYSQILGQILTATSGAEESRLAMTILAAGAVKTVLSLTPTASTLQGDFLVTGRVNAAFSSAFGPTDEVAATAASGVILSSSGIVITKRTGTGGSNFQMYTNADTTPVLRGQLGASGVNTILSNDSTGSIVLRAGGFGTSAGQVEITNGGNIILAAGNALFFGADDRLDYDDATNTYNFYSDGSSTNSSVKAGAGLGNVVGARDAGAAYNGDGCWIGYVASRSIFSGLSASAIVLNRGTTTGAIMSMRYNGAEVGTISVTAAGAQFNQTSDERLKTFIGEYDPLKAIDIIRRDPMREFTWNADGSYAVGWGAQTSYSISRDLAQPGEWDAEENKETAWGMDFSRRVPYLWSAMSWALDQIDALHARIKALEEAGAPA